jgi:RHS repeat-associated protein
LTFNSYRSDSKAANNYLFNGIERQDEIGLDWDLADFRTYDAYTGRWLQIDPRTLEGGPYVGFANISTLYSDPRGDTIILIGNQLDGVVVDDRASSSSEILMQELQHAADMVTGLSLKIAEGK